MGVGWIFKGSQDQIAKGYIGFTNWPLSTRAELTAILMALCTVPSNLTCSIYTDSQAAIDGINKLFTLGDLWKWNKTSNNSIKAVIGLLWNIKNISLSFIKVKGHSNDEYNDIADSLAKNGASEGSEGVFIDLDSFTFSLISNFSDRLGNVRINASWKNLGINQGIRGFIKWLHNTGTKAFVVNG